MISIALWLLNDVFFGGLSLLFFSLILEALL